MKQGDHFLKIITVLLAAAVLSYFGYAVWRAAAAPAATVTALAYEADVGAEAVGYVVRDEVQLSAPAGNVVPARSEGERVGCGQVLAAVYGSAEAAARQTEVRNLQAQLRQLDYALDDPGSDQALDRAVRDLLTRCARRTALRELPGDLGDELKGRILRSSAGDGTLETLAAEQTALTAALSERTGGAETVLTAAESGHFSGTADGYEAVLTPAALDAMTLADFDALEGAAKPAADGVYGRLIRSEQWYFVTAVDTARLEGLAEGDTVRLSFPRDAFEDADMEILRIGPGEGGRSLLVLGCGSRLGDVTLLRRQACTLTFRSYAGLRVPKEALCTGADGTAGVYVREGAVARFKAVDVLYESEDGYVAALDQTSTENLWPGDEILIGSNYYDGKVVSES